MCCMRALVSREDCEMKKACNRFQSRAYDRAKSLALATGFDQEEARKSAHRAAYEFFWLGSVDAD